MAMKRWAVVNAAAWLGVSVAVCVAIWQTGSLMALWAFIFPTLNGLKYLPDGGKRGEGENE